MVGPHTKAAHIWPLSRLQRTKTTTLGFAETAKPVEYIRLLALLPETCYPLTATFFYVVILATFPIQMFPPCSTISIDGRRFGDPWIDSTTQCRHLETKHHIQKLLAFISSVTSNSFPHRQMGLVSLAFLWA